MQKSYILFLVAIATCLGGVLSDEDVVEREKKLISTFQIVRFPNDACVGSNSKNGTCYTSAECSDKGGSSQGSCADGFGVCCTFIVDTCTQTSSENITYWTMTPTQSTTVPSECGLTICPVNDAIGQLRIDFTTFVISGPSTTTVLEGNHQYASIPKYGKAIVASTASAWKTNCLVDQFSIEGLTPSNSPPTICGVNSGFHMYVDANPRCNNMLFSFSPQSGPVAANAATTTRGMSSLATRSWDMTIYQIEMGHIMQAPPGCTQYHWGTTKSLVTSFNQQAATTGLHLANQNQKMCIRRERGYCWACFAKDANVISFEIAGESGTNKSIANTSQVCGYSTEGNNGLGAAGTVGANFDCVIIPGAFVVAAAIATGGAVIAGPTLANIRSTAAANYNTPAPPQIQGLQVFGVGTADLNTVLTSIVGTNVLATVCTAHVPFMMQFKSDGWEGTGLANGEHLNSNVGVSLTYELVTCT